MDGRGVAHARIASGDKNGAVDDLVGSRGAAVPPDDVEGQKHSEDRRNGGEDAANVGELEEGDPEGYLDENGAEAGHGQEFGVGVVEQEGRGGDGPGIGRHGCDNIVHPFLTWDYAVNDTSSKKKFPQ
jgi:hypothetical protein